MYKSFSNAGSYNYLQQGVDVFTDICLSVCLFVGLHNKYLTRYVKVGCVAIRTYYDLEWIWIKGHINDLFAQLFKNGCKCVVCKPTSSWLRKLSNQHPRMSAWLLGWKCISHVITGFMGIVVIHTVTSFSKDHSLELVFKSL